MSDDSDDERPTGQSNLVTSIHHLPNEILVTILLLCATYQHKRYLARVCRLWASLIIQTPEFWTRINGHDKAAYTRTSLRHSRSAPLDIEFESNGEGKDLENRWEMVLANLARWRTADLAVHPGEIGQPRWKIDTSAVKHLETHPAPTLVKFSLYSTAVIPPVDLFGGDAPNLRSLRLQHLALRDWSSPITRNLTSLSLIRCRPIVTLACVRTIIRECCLTLEELTLWALELPQTPFTSDTEPPIDTVNLRSLTVIDQQGFLLPLLSCASVPTSHHTNVDLHWDEYDKDQHVPMARTIATLLTPNLRAVGAEHRSEITYNYKNPRQILFEVKVPGRCQLQARIQPSHYLHSEFRLFWPKTIYPIIASPPQSSGEMPPPPKVALVLDIRVGAFETNFRPWNHWVILEGLAEIVTDLSLTHWGVELGREELLEILSALAGDTKPTICPLLEELTFVNCVVSDHKAILGFMDRRPDVAVNWATKETYREELKTSVRLSGGTGEGLLSGVQTLEGRLQILASLPTIDVTREW